MITRYNWLLPVGKHTTSPKGVYQIHYVVRCYRNGKRFRTLDFISEDYVEAMAYRRERTAEERDRIAVEEWLVR